MTFPDNVNLRGSVYLVAGASGGIGKSLSILLHSLNATVVLVDLSTELLVDLVDDLSKSNPNAPKPQVFAADISSESSLKDLTTWYSAHFQHINGLINCVGLLRTGESLKPISETSLSEWETIINVNLTGTFLLNRAFIPIMQKQRFGDIINISSVSGTQGRAFDGPYCSSKFGIIGLSESIAAEVSSSGIRVQCLLPDAVNTDLWLQNGSTSIQPSLMMSSENVASVILYMLQLPSDIYMLNPIIAPMKRPKRRRNNI